MVILYKDPQGRHIFTRNYNHSQSTKSTAVVDKQLSELEKHCQKLEHQLETYKVREQNVSATYILVARPLYQDIFNYYHCQ